VRKSHINLEELIVVKMDSVKVSGISTGLGLVYWTDIISGVLMCVMFAINIYYLVLKAKKIKEA